MPYPLTKDGKQLRGFAAMPKEKQRDIASKGGKSSRGGGRKPRSTAESSTKEISDPANRGDAGPLIG